MMCKKFWGVPGSGKTTKLLELAGHVRQTGYLWSDICFITFARWMAEDFIERVFDKFDSDFSYSRRKYEELPYFATIHGVCNRLVKRDRKVICDSESESKTGVEYYKKFFSENGIDYNTGNDRTNDSTPGNLFISLKSWMTNTMKFMRDYQNNIQYISNYCDEYPGDDKLLPDFFESTESKFRKFKEKNNLIDYDDMLIEVIRDGLYPPTKVLLVDEFQDFSPLQYKIYSIWRDMSEVVFIVGDPMQSIYSFQGASPDFFINEPFELEVLPNTHRFGDNTWSYAKELLDYYGADIPNGVYGVVPLGRDVLPSFINIEEIVQKVSSYNDLEVFILTHANYMAKVIGNILKNSGILFYGRRAGGWSKNMDAVAIYNSILLLRKRDNYKIPSTQWTKFLNSLRKEYRGLTRKEIKALELPEWVGIDDVKSHIPILRIPEFTSTITNSNMFVADTFPLKKIEDNCFENESFFMIKNALAQKNPKFFGEKGVYVGTIHSKKGQEADIVFVSNEISQSAYNKWVESGDEGELLRMFYVGVTRNRKKLYVVDNTPAKYKFELPGIVENKNGDING